MAAVALKMKVRVHYTAKEMLRRTKRKDEKEVVELLNKMAYNGLIEKTHEGKNGELAWASEIRHGKCRIHEYALGRFAKT